MVDNLEDENLSFAERPGPFNVAAYPNPFNPTTTLLYTVETPAQVTLTVFDIRGRKIVTLAKGKHAAGVYQVPWQARDDLASGVYFYRFVAVPGDGNVHRASGKLLFTK